MTIKLFKAISIVALGLSIVSTIFGQDPRVVSAAGDKYVISAKAGGVNYTEGRVVIARREGKSGQLLKGDEIQIGDTVATGTDGRAEILLNPGSYMRVDKETEFAFVSTSLDDLRIKLNSGSAIFEVIADSDFTVSVRSPKVTIDLVRSGVYRIDVAADGQAKISVTKGLASVGADAVEVKPGRLATVGGESVAVAKFDRDQKDSLDIWSKERAKELTKVNAGLQRKVLRDSLISSFNHRGWNMYDSFGLWIFDPMRTYWCFMPFGYGWGSPYGFGYGYDFWTLGMPNWIYYQPPPVRRSPAAGTPTGGPSPSGGTMPTGGASNPQRRRVDSSPAQPSAERATPPYRRIESARRGSDGGFPPSRIDMPRSIDTGSPTPGNQGGTVIPSAPAREPSAPVRSAPTREPGPREKP